MQWLFNILLILVTKHLLSVWIVLGSMSDDGCEFLCWPSILMPIGELITGTQSLKYDIERYWNPWVHHGTRTSNDSSVFCIHTLFWNVKPRCSIQFIEILKVKLVFLEFKDIFIFFIQEENMPQCLVLHVVWNKVSSPIVVLEWGRKIPGNHQNQGRKNTFNYICFLSLIYWKKYLSKPEKFFLQLSKWVASGEKGIKDIERRN